MVRHRVTRLIRESYRLNEKSFRQGLDIVVVARPNAKDRTYQEIESALMHLARRMKICREAEVHSEEAGNESVKSKEQ